MNEISMSLVFIFFYILLRGSFLNFHHWDCNLTKIYANSVPSA